MGIFVAAALTALLGFGLWRERDQIETETFRETANIAALLDAHVAQSMEGTAEVRRAFVERARIALANRTVNAPSFATEFALLPQGLPQIAGLVLLDSAGRVIASSVPSEPLGTDLADASFYRDALAAGTAQNQSHIGTLMHDAQSGRWFIPMSGVVNDQNGARLGVAFVMIDPRAFVGLFNVLNFGRFSSVTLLQSDGIIVARSPEEDRFVGRTIAGGALDRRLLQAPLGSLRIKGVLYGRDLFMSYQRIVGTPYVVNVAFDAEQVLLPWYRLLRLYAALGVVLLLAIVLSIWIVRQDQLRRMKMAAAQQVQDIIEGMSTQVALLDADGRVLEINRAFLASAGVSRAGVIGRPLWEASCYAHGKESQKHVRAALERARRGEITRGDFALRMGDAAFATVDTTFQPISLSTGRPMRVIVSGVDVTERRHLEQQLAQSQKLEAIGLLAGGIAHDFNNLLAAIANYAGFLVEDLKAQPSEQAHATRISRACEHGKQVVKQLLAYASPARAARSAIELRAVFSEMEMLVRPSLQPGTELAVVAEPGQVHVRADQAELVQVLVNLCLNAKDALSGGKGTVRVALAKARPSHLIHPALVFTASIDNDWAVRRSGRADWSKSYAVITVADDGDGMAPQMLERVFDPFFTTKSADRGTGLGLAIVDNIVLSLGGVYQMKTRPGYGTEFSLYLPLEEKARAADVQPERIAPDLSRKIRVLFVDDDLNVAEAMAIAMTRLQCEAVAVDDPVEALAAINEDPGAWDVIVTDEHMPEMNGTDLIAKLKLRNPDLPIILWSGSESISEAIAKRKGAAAFFRKPANPAHLAEAIKNVFDAMQKAGVA